MLRTRTILLCTATAIFMACQPPPPAPEGLDEAIRFMLREFYEDDATVSAGLTGLLNWYDEEGYQLEGQGATIDEDNQDEGMEPASAFQLDDLQWEDLHRMPIPEDGRDLANANGIVSISEMACHWRRAEGLLVRPDQNVVFEDFDSYDRTYGSSRAVFETASVDEDFAPVDEALPDLNVADLLLGDLERSVMPTTSHVASTEVGVSLNYDLVLHFRHGIFDVQDEQIPVWFIASYLPTPASGPDGNNTFAQSYSIEVNYGLGDRTLRIFGVWTYVDSILAGPDSPLWSTGAVNKSRNAAERLSDICAGIIEIPDES